MEYLKLFSTESDYIAYRDSNDYLKPNVSLSDDKGSVYYNYPPPIVYEAVDLELPSHTKWATTNVGAKSPEEYGLFFQWGDTVGYSGITTDKKFSWSDCKYSVNGSSNVFSKYGGSTAADMTLDLSDDAAHVNMGGDWHMPSSAQINELIDNTTQAVETVNGKSGMRYISKKDASKSIFVPFAGLCDRGDHGSVGYYGNFWSSSRYSNVSYGYNLNCTNDGDDTWLDYDDRYYGLSVRGVLG